MAFFEAADGVCLLQRQANVVKAIEQAMLAERVDFEVDFLAVRPDHDLPLQIDGQRAWFGDGSMRQIAPISPAIHLGAQRILIVGAGQLNAPNRFVPPPGADGDAPYPSLAQIAGHAMSSIFLDALAMDIERLERVNNTVRLISPDARPHSRLREVEVLVIAPSQRIDAIANRHVGALPRTVRALLRAMKSSRWRRLAMMAAFDRSSWAIFSSWKER